MIAESENISLLPCCANTGDGTGHAGNTARSGWGISCSTVHPRVCGEHCRDILQMLAGAGSSPRMRGTLEPAMTAGGLARFIPAYAGNTVTIAFRVRWNSVHPRVCEEHFTSRYSLAASIGSSPRMRGTLTGERSSGGSSRFIPAYAGNTVALLNTILAWSVHPRVCGEHFLPSNLLNDLVGSSPRMRGTLSGRCRAAT